MITLEPVSTPSEPPKSALHLIRKKVKEGLEPRSQVVCDLAYVNSRPGLETF